MTALLDIVLWLGIGIISCFLVAETQAVKHCWRGYYSLRIVLCCLVFWSALNVLGMISRGMPDIQWYYLVDHVLILTILLIMHLLAMARNPY